MDKDPYSAWDAKLRKRVLSAEKDHTKVGFPRWTYTQKLGRAYWLGADDERIRLCRALEKEYPELPISDFIYGIGGD